MTIFAACGGGGGGSGSGNSETGSPPPPPPVSPPPPPQPDPVGVVTQLTGSVGDGPITDASLVTYRKDGQAAATFNSDATANYVYSIQIEESDYPLTISATGGTDLVTGMEPDFELLSTALRPHSRVRSNVNPHSTIMVGIATRKAGGLTSNSLASARTTVLSNLNFGLDPELVADPIGSEITDENVAVMVKASETLGEMLRRTRDALMNTGVTSADEIVHAIAADLTDDALDGRGADEADARIAAVASLTSAVVLVEALTNDLLVNGAPAAPLLDAAIATVRPSAPATAVTGNVGTNDQMLYQLRVAVQAAAELTGDPELESLGNVLDEIGSGALPGDVENLLPGDAVQRLTDAVETAVFATDDELETVNRIVRTGGDVPEPPPLPANLPPQIVELADQTVTVGEELVVDVLASDIDGPDPLVLTAEALPQGAEFVDEGNGLGRLYWSPVASQASSEPYVVNFTATDDGGLGLASSASIEIRVEERADGSLLTATLSPAPDRVDLTAYGTADWVHWGRETESSVDRKAAGGAVLGDYRSIDGVATRRYQSSIGGRTAFSWSDGSPVAAVTDTATGLYVSGIGKGFELSIPVTADSQVLRLYLGGWQALGRIEVSLDGDMVWSEVTGDMGDGFDTIVELHFAADATGQELAVRYLIEQSDGGNIALQAAALQGDAPAPVSGSATLTWEPPTLRVDGTPLDAVDAYEIRYGRSPEALDSVIDVGGGETSRTIDGLTSGEWHFAMTAIDTLGQRSPLSEVVSKVIP